MLGFNGGLLGVRKVPTTGNATGLWMPNEQSVAKQAGIWPVTGANTARYFRLANFANTSLVANVLDFGEIEVYDGNTKHTGITCTTNISWNVGQDSYLVDGAANTNVRAYVGGWSGIRSTTTITLDLGSTKTVTHIKIFSLFSQPRFPSSFDLQSSADNATYVLVATVAVDTTFDTSNSGNEVYASDKVSIL